MQGIWFLKFSLCTIDRITVLQAKFLIITFSVRFYVVSNLITDKDSWKDIPKCHP